MKPGAGVIASVSGYECQAIVLGLTPTITALLKARPRWFRNVVVAAVSVWLYLHLEDDSWPIQILP